MYHLSMSVKVIAASAALDYVYILYNLIDEVILECTFDNLMKQIGEKYLMNVST